MATAGVAALLVVVGIGCGTPDLASRAAASKTAVVAGSSSIPSSTPTSIPVSDAPNCQLPLLVTGPGPAPQAPSVTAGFVSPRTGEFQADPGATSNGMPFPAFYTSDTWRPVSYDAVLRRWLPVLPQAVSGDHGSFAYTVFKPLSPGKTSGVVSSSELHVYNLKTGKDRLLWAPAAELDLPTWKNGLIAVTTTPLDGGTVDGWLIDPGTGRRTNTGPPGPDDMFVKGWVGTDSQGRPIVMDGSRGPRAEYSLIAADGSRIVIKAGGGAGPADFDPNGLVGDGNRLWGANFDGTALWMWTQNGGLRRLPLAAGPKKDIYVTYSVAGPCV